MKKPKKVKIKQISSFYVDHVGIMVILGLGDDSKVYQWRNAEWFLRND